MEFYGCAMKAHIVGLLKHPNHKTLAQLMSSKDAKKMHTWWDPKHAKILYCQYSEKMIQQRIEL